MKDLKNPTVYLETSFINRLADPRKRDSRTRQEQLDSREWWRVYRSVDCSCLASRKSNTQQADRAGEGKTARQGGAYAAGLSRRSTSAMIS